MKILDCTEFAKVHDAKRHYFDDPWTYDLNWKGYLNDGYTHVIYDDELWTISKHGPDVMVCGITRYDPKGN